MAYVEAHAGLREHPKTKKASRALGISRVQMIGHLLCLWWWCQEYAQDGNLAQFEDDDIAIAADWEGDAKSFVNSLLKCGTKGNAGFLARNEHDEIVINDWMQYGGKLFTKRIQGVERQRRKRENERDVTRDSRVTDTDNQPMSRVTDTNVTHIDKIRKEEIREDEKIKDIAHSAPLSAKKEEPENETADTLSIPYPHPIDTPSTQNGKHEPKPVKARTPKPVKARTPKPPPVDEPQQPGQKEMFGAICQAVYGHSKYDILTGRQKGTLGTEAKTLLGIGATPAMVAQWYKEKWLTQWPGNKGNKPNFDQLRAGVASFIERQNGVVLDIDFDAPAKPKHDLNTKAGRTQAAIDAVFDRIERGEIQLAEGYA